MKRIYYAAIPLALLGLAHLTLVLDPTASNAWAAGGYLNSLPYTLFCFVILLGARFNQERYVILGILYFGFMITIDRFMFTDQNLSAGGGALFMASVLIPINLLIVYMLPSRGVMSYAGLTRSLTMLLQCAALLLFTGSRSTWIQALPDWNLLLAGAPSWIRIPEPSLFLFLAVLGYLAYQLRRNQDLQTLMFLCLLICSIAPFNFHSSIYSDSSAQGTFLALFSVNACVLIFNILETSLGAAMLDPLTQLPARRALNEHMNALVSPYCIAMIDIDHFKLTNDKHGHETGDQVLRFLANRLKHIPFGRAYRYGGEEFTIVSASWEKNDIVPLLDELRRSIESATFLVRGKRAGKRKRGSSTEDAATTELPITVSIGVAQSSKTNPNADAVLLAADKALYKAKNNGRNRVEAAYR